MNQVTGSRRWLNATIDILIIKWVVVITWDFIVLKINPYAYDSQPNLQLFLYLRWAICFFLYYFIFEYFTGRTIGKLITQTKAMFKTGAYPTAKQILFRSLLRCVPFEAFTFLGKGENGLHDVGSDTIVVESSVPYLDNGNKRLIAWPKISLKIKDKRTKYIIFGAIAVLILTNPSLRAFKEHLGQENYEGLSRSYNFFVFSFFNDGGHDYIGIAENFIEI